jgi:hypothetical protein
VALSVPTVAAATGNTLYVLSTGSNSGDCTSSSSPCQTVSYALTQASSGDTIEVAGTVSDNVTDSSLSSLTIEQWPSRSAAVLEPHVSSEQILNFSSGGSLTLDGISFEQGRATTGSAIEDVSSTLNINDATFSSNVNTSAFGAIYNRYGTIDISGSTFSGNSTRSDGGAIFNFEATTNISNSTFFGNVATNGPGSTIANDLGTVAIVDSTISGHSGSTIWANGTMIFAGDVIADSSGAPSGHECSSSGGTFTDDGYNVDDDGSCGFSSANNSVSDSPTIDRYLGPLQNNGGPTDTIELLPGNASTPNPAEHVIPSSFELPGGTVACSFPDQRGITRQSPCDMGAYSMRELYSLPDGTGSVPCTTESATPTSVCSLETAITEANTELNDVVDLEAPDGDSLYSGVAAAGVHLTVSAPMVLQTDPDPGFDSGQATLDGEGNNGVLTLTNSVDVAVSDVEIENGDAPFGVFGGGIKNASNGTLTVAESDISDNSGQEGGGISNSNGGTVDVWGSTFAGNYSDGGGAITNGEGGAGTLNVSDSLFEGNTAGNWGGGAILNGYGAGGNGTAIIRESTFVGNAAYSDGYGSGIDNSDNGGGGSLTVTQSTFMDQGEIDNAGSGSGTVTVAADIFAGFCDQRAGGTWNDDGYNEGLDTSCFNGGTGDDDSAGTGLTNYFGPLADNGGPTETMILVSGNPAIGLIPDSTSGLCPVAADQRGDASAAGEACNAGSVQALSAQSIGALSTAPTSAVVGGATYAPSASASSGLPVAITVDSSTASVCSISGGIVSFTASGNCELDFNQAGDTYWEAAPQVQQTFTVAAILPTAPTNVMATAFGLIPPYSATVSWQPPSGTGGETLSGYTVVADNLTLSESSPPDDVSSSATSAQITGLIPGNLYDFTVTAVNSIGPGPSVTTNDVVPVGVAPAGAPDVGRGTSTNPSGRPSASVGQSGRTGSISATASGQGTLIVERYPSDPIGTVPFAAQFYDVSVDPGASFDQVSFTVCGAGSGAQLEWWDAYQTTPGFEPVSNQTWDSGASCATVTIGTATQPSLSELVGTVIEVPTANTTTGNDGYVAAGADGGVFAYGGAGFYGSRGGRPLSAPIVGVAFVPGSEGYWLVASDGGVFAYGDAAFYGSRAGHPLSAPIVGIASTPSGNGYWLVAADGGVFAYGEATFYGSRAGHPLSAPIVGIASTSTGDGYWLVAADGGVFAYGDATFYGSRAGKPLNRPVVGITATSNGEGYWLVAGDGGVFSYGDATFYGSHGAGTLSAPVTGMALDPEGNGYWLVGSDGGVFAYGDATYYGRVRMPLDAPVVGIAAS